MFGTLISTAQLAQHLGDADWLIFDCRYTLTEPAVGRQDYATDHIPGAIYVDVEVDLSAPVSSSGGRHPLPPAEQLVRTFSRWGIDSRKQVVVYDDAFGSVAARLWWMLKWLGHDNVALLDGGYSKWKREKRPLDNVLPQPRPANFNAHPRPGMIASSAEVVRAMDDPGSLIVDARAEVRFQGISEPFDKIAGHIPNAVNHPYDANLDISGEYLCDDELAEVYQQLLGQHAPDNVIVLCGSGVTACHNLIAMERLGLRGAKLYVGSWSDWISDPSRPVATKT